METNKKCELLKNEIQDIIDKQSKDTDDYKSLEESKQILLLELNKIITSLNSEYTKVSKITESMLYYRVKNKPNSHELMEELKQNREIAQNNFEKIKLIEQEYIQKENSINCNVPGFLFFHKDITDKYNLCPFIKITEQDNVIENRHNWLKSQYDNGELYYNLYNKIINKTTLNELNNTRLNLEESFNKTHLDFFTDEQSILYSSICESIIDYKTFTIKTKKLKEKFKIIINNVTNLVNETTLQINEYISLYYDLYIPVNTNKTASAQQGDIKLERIIYKLYEDKIEEYKNTLEDIKLANKFIINTKNHLKQLLYEYLFNDSNIKLNIKQNGKYFKKWSLLNDEEKKERYESFSSYFVDKFLVEPNLIVGIEIQTLKTNLYKLLIDKYKNIKHKHLKWDIKKGYLEQINCLKYDNYKREFYLKINETNLEKDTKTKKTISTSTIFNKHNEKIINEEIVVFLINLKNNQKLDLTTNLKDIKIFKDECIEQLKIKMLLKRVNANDKIKIYKIFDDIFNVILHN